MSEVPPDIRKVLARDFILSTRKYKTERRFFRNVEARIETEQPEIYEFIEQYIDEYFPEKTKTRKFAKEGMLFLYEIMRRHQETRELEDNFKRMFSRFE